MELKDTIEMMGSSDYKKRFKAEYRQTKIRYDKLRHMITKREEEDLTFDEEVTLNIHKEQAKTMFKYLFVLELRSKMENIEL